MKYKFKVEGIDCPNCAAKLAANMEKIEGIESAKINFLTAKLVVETSLEESVALKALAREAKKFSEDVTVE